MIRLRGVSKRYAPEGPCVLRQLDLQVAQRAYVSLTGPSGSGKSTLLNLVGGLDRPTEGRLEVAGQDLGALDEDGLARFRGTHVGVVFQFFQLLPSLSLLENLRFAMDVVGAVPRAQRSDRARALLGEVGLADLADRLPSQVSGGQQQRAAIARALANEPSLVVADEPTGNLDSASAGRVLDAFDAVVQRGATLVVVTHDPAVAARADRTVQLVDGRVVTDVGVVS